MEKNNLTMDSTEIKKCIICNEEGEEVANLPNFPITELFFDKEKDIELPTTSENQALIYCNNCSHMFLKNTFLKTLFTAIIFRIITKWQRTTIIK